MNISECTILITGASGNLGRALAEHFAPRSSHLILTGRSQGALDACAASVRDLGGAFTAVPCDLRDSADVSNLVDSVNELDQPLDVLIHNAADVTSKPLRETTSGEIESLVRANLSGPLSLTRALLPAMDRSAYKRIAWISSLAGYKANPAQTVYSITKSGVNASARALSAELSVAGYRVLNVPLSTVRFGANGNAASVCARIEGAIVAGKPELFLSPVSRLLMRFYGMFPGLMR